MTTIRTFTAAVIAGCALAVAAPAAVSAGPPTSNVQYIADARSYVYTAYSYDETFIAATLYKSGGTEIYVSLVHGPDASTGANGYVAGQGRAYNGTVKIPKNLSKATINGKVHLDNGTTVTIREDFTATGPVVVTLYPNPVSPDLVGHLYARTAPVNPGNWVAGDLREADVYRLPVTP